MKRMTSCVTVREFYFKASNPKTNAAISASSPPRASPIPQPNTRPTKIYYISRTTATPSSKSSPPPTSKSTMNSERSWKSAMKRPPIYASSKRGPNHKNSNLTSRSKSNLHHMQQIKTTSLLRRYRHLQTRRFGYFPLRHHQTLRRKQWSLYCWSHQEPFRNIDLQSAALQILWKNRNAHSLWLPCQVTQFLQQRISDFWENRSQYNFQKYPFCHSEHGLDKQPIMADDSYIIPVKTNSSESETFECVTHFVDLSKVTEDPMPWQFKLHMVEV